MLVLRPYSSLPENHYGFAETHDLRPLYLAGYHLGERTARDTNRSRTGNSLPSRPRVNIL
jgi:hypothetical protein